MSLRGQFLGGQTAEGSAVFSPARSRKWGLGSKPFSIRLSPTTWILRGWDTGFALRCESGGKKLVPQSWRSVEESVQPRSTRRWAQAQKRFKIRLISTARHFEAGMQVLYSARVGRQSFEELLKPLLEI